MKNFDIEAYIEGELTGKERQAFEQEMQQNPSLRAEVETQRMVIERLRRQLLREQVTTAMKDAGSAAPSNSFKWKDWIWLLIIPVVLAIGYFENQYKSQTISIEETTSTSNEITPPQEEIPPTIFEEETETSNHTSSEPQKKKYTPPPIAETTTPSTIPPTIPQPNIRGAEPGNEAWAAMLDSVWHSTFPPANAEFSEAFQPTVQLLSEQDFSKAFVRLRLLERKMPKNDTVLFLKAYCLTELKEGGEALRYFDDIQSAPTAWQTHLGWYRGLSYLLIGEKESAKTVFEQISKDKNHPFKVHGERVLEWLR